MKFICLFSLLILMITSCSDPTGHDSELEIGGSGAFILNEGNFGQSNGSLSFYNFDSKKMMNHIFEKVNNRSLGDVVQSMTIIDSTGYIIVNGSSTIEIINLTTWKSTGTIPITGGSPRTLLRVTPARAYVTNLFTNNITIIDLVNHDVTGSISVGKNPDAMVFTQNRVFVANGAFGGDNSIFVINPLNDQVIDTITVAYGPVSLNIDLSGNIQVLCSGYSDNNNSDNDTDGGIFVINPSTFEVIDQVMIAGHPTAAQLDTGGKGYYSNNGVLYAYHTASVTSPADSIMQVSLYGMNIDVVHDKIYTLDAKDFVQAGDLNIYNLNGDLLETHQTDIIPGYITFYYGQ